MFAERLPLLLLLLSVSMMCRKEVLFLTINRECGSRRSFPNKQIVLKMPCANTSRKQTDFVKFETSPNTLGIFVSYSVSLLLNYARFVIPCVYLHTAAQSNQAVDRETQLH